MDFPTSYRGWCHLSMILKFWCMKKTNLRSKILIYDSEGVLPCYIGFCSCPRRFEGDQGTVASSIARDFQLCPQVIPSCLHQSQAPSPLPMMILNWIGSCNFETLSWFFYATHKLMPPLDLQSPVLDVQKTSQGTLADTRAKIDQM